MTEPSVKSSRKLEMGLSIQKREGKDLKGALLTSKEKMAGMWPLAEIATLRPLKRYIQRELETRVARALIADEITPGGTVKVDAKGDSLVIKNAEVGTTEEKVVEMKRK